MPRPHETVSICGQKDGDCVSKVFQELQSQQNSSFSCSHCYSGCFSLTYDKTFSTAQLFQEEPFLKQNHLKRKEIAVVHLHYIESNIHIYKIEELVGFADFLCKNISDFISRLNHILIVFMFIFIFTCMQPVLVASWACSWDSVQFQ